MRARRALTAAIASVLLLAGSACGDDDDAGGGPDDGGGGDTAAQDAGSGGDLPDGCAAGPVTIPVTGGEALPGVDGPAFEATDAVVAQQPIVLDPDGDLGIEDLADAAADAELVAYTVYLADFPLGPDDAATIGIGDPPDGGTFFAFSVVPPTAEPIAEGDVIRAGRPEFESTTTFATVGTQYGTAVAEDEPRLAVDDDGGEVEVLHLDDERICLAWSQSGSLFGGETSGAWSIDAVVSGPLAPRARVPFS